MPNHPSVLRGALLKIEGVLLLAKSEPDGAQALKDDPKRFVEKLGIILTDEESEALVDVVHGTANSRFVDPPPNAPFDKMQDLRDMWNGSKGA